MSENADKDRRCGPQRSFDDQRERLSIDAGTFSDQTSLTICFRTTWRDSFGRQRVSCDKWLFW